MSILDQKYKELKISGLDFGYPLMEQQPTPKGTWLWCSYEKGNLCNKRLCPCGCPNGGYATVGAQKYYAALSAEIRQLEAIQTTA